MVALVLCHPSLLTPAQARRGRAALRPGGGGGPALAAFLDDAFRGRCPVGDDLCWVRACLAEGGRPAATAEMRRLLRTAFRPPAPGRRWLSTGDIDRVLRQYEAALLPAFRFLGTVPADFAVARGGGPEDVTCLPGAGALCDALRAPGRGGARQLAFVMNLDPSHLPGSHWVAVFVDLPAGEFSYFDSRGDPPPLPVLRYFHRLSAAAVEAGGPPLRMEYNNRRVQRGDSECGVFAVFYILVRLGVLPPDAGARDADMASLRSVLFLWGTRGTPPNPPGEGKP